VAINKAQSPTWVKVTLVVLIVAFVLSFITIVANPFSAPSTGQAQQPAGATDASDAQYQPQVNSLTAQLQADPNNYGTLVTLANTYFDWAIAKQQASQNTTSGADMPLWISAKDTYARALEVKGDESPVRIDYSITLFYTGDAAGAIKTAEKVVAEDPTFSPAHFNLGVFYSATGDAAKALAAFEKYLELDPTGKSGGNVEYAKQQIQALKSAGTGGAQPLTTTTP